MNKSIAGVLVLLMVLAALPGCAQTPVTFGPYASYGGDEGAGPQQWQVGIGAWFVLGKEGVVVPPAGVPAMPSNVRVEAAQPQGPTTTNNNTTNQNTINNNGNTTNNDNSRDHIHNNGK